MEGFYSAYHVQSQGACSVISTMQSGSHGSAQSKEIGAHGGQRGIEHGITITDWTSTDGCGSSGYSGHCRSNAVIPRRDQRRRDSGSNRFDGDGRGRRAHRVGRHRQQEDCQAIAPIQRGHLTDEGSKSPSESQSGPQRCQRGSQRDVVLPRISEAEVVQGFSDFFAELDLHRSTWGHHVCSSGQVFPESSECGFADENMDDFANCNALKASGQQSNAIITTHPSVQEFEPYDVHEESSSIWNAGLCSENDHTWCTWALRQNVKSLRPTRKVKSVSFHDTVNVTILDQSGKIEFDVKQSLVHDMLRHFWHLDGQIVNTDVMRRTVTRLGLNGNVDIVASAGSFRTDSGNTQMSELVDAYETGHTDSGALWWTDLLASTMVSGRGKPSFIATWFLAVDRIALCLRPRRVKLSDSGNFREFQAACAEAWKELYDMQSCQYYLVDGQPPGLPSTVAHVLIVQGSHPHHNAFLIHGQSLPPLFTVRAVLLENEVTVKEVFRAAQFPQACGSRRTVCYVKFLHAGRRWLQENDEIARIPLAKFVTGDARLDGDEDGASDATEATEEPGTDNEEIDDVSLLSWGSGEFDATEPRWAWEPNSQLVRNEKEAHVESCLSHSSHSRQQSYCALPMHCGGEGNSDLTWHAHWDEVGTLDCFSDDIPTWCRFRQGASETNAVQTGEFEPQILSVGASHGSAVYDTVKSIEFQENILRAERHHLLAHPAGITPSGVCGHDHESEEDISSFVSYGPVTHFHDPPQAPTWDLEEGQEVENITEQVIEDAIFADGHLAEAQAYADLTMQEVSDSEMRWTAITYGLGLIDLGRRDCSFHPSHLGDLPAAIQQLWADHGRYGDLTIYFVNPQPSEIGGIGTMVFLVVVASPADNEPDIRNILVIQRGPPDITLRPVPYGAKILTDATQQDILMQLDMNRHCRPFQLRDCIVRLGFDVMVPPQVHQVQNGMLCTVRVSDRPEAVVEAMDFIVHAETFYLQVEELQALMGDVFVITCHVHGISPENHPLGWRTMVLQGNDLLSTTWFEQMVRLWPFDYEEARLVFCPMATDDMRDANHVFFHFIVDYGVQEGHPILVQQRLRVANDIPQGNEGTTERWAITLMDGPITADIVPILSMPPLWFEYALAQNMGPSVLVNGRRLRELVVDWQTDDFLAVTSMFGTSGSYFPFFCEKV